MISDDTNNMNMPKYTLINYEFEYTNTGQYSINLRIYAKGQFICSNSTDIDLRDMYNMIDENYESLYQYFSQINYTLERGNEYFYFSRTESKTTLEQRYSVPIIG